MNTVLYIHGFLSSPLSQKAQSTSKWLTAHHKDLRFICPQLSSYPAQTKKQLYKCIEQEKPAKLFVIGSSMGGYWATHLVEHGLADKAVLINPAVLPQSRFQEFIGVAQKSYYSDDVVTLSSQDIDDLIGFDVNPIKRQDQYWLMVQKGDETLDYRLALEKYRRCKQLVEEGGNHSFVGYERWLPKIMAFFSGSPQP